MQYCTKSEELDFFKRHKLKMDIPTSITCADIPAPTKEDLEWGKRIYKTRREKLTEEDKNPDNLWRLGFLLTVPDHGKFAYYYGMGGKGYNDFMPRYIEQENLEAIALCTEYCTHHQNRKATFLKIIDTKPLDFVKELTNRLPKPFGELCKETSTLDAAITKGDLDLVEFFCASGADIVKSHEYLVQHALGQQQPEIARFLTDRYNEVQEAAGLKDKANPEIEASNGDRWEYMGQKQVAKHSTFDDGMQSLTEIFNFGSEQIITVQNNAKLNIASSFPQNFRDIQNQEYIEEAAEQLRILGGDAKTNSQVQKSPLSIPLRKG